MYLIFWNLYFIIEIKGGKKSNGKSTKANGYLDRTLELIKAGVETVGGIYIGDNVVAAAGSVVTHNVPPNAAVGDVPAKIIKNIKGEK